MPEEQEEMKWIQLPMLTEKEILLAAVMIYSFGLKGEEL